MPTSDQQARFGRQEDDRRSYGRIIRGGNDEDKIVVTTVSVQETIGRLVVT